MKKIKRQKYEEDWVSCQHVPAANSRQSIQPKVKKSGKPGEDTKVKQKVKSHFLYFNKVPGLSSATLVKKRL